MKNAVLQSAIVLVAAVALSVLFDFSLSNTWQGLVVLPVVFGPLWKYGWNYAKAQKFQKPGMILMLRFVLLLLLAGYVITVIGVMCGIL